MSPVPAKDTTKNNKNDEDETLEVLIIGAGLAGLAAAKELQSKGMRKVRILEGRPTYGGRCRTEVLSDGVTIGEHGAQWIHGARKTNPIYKAALEAGVDLQRSAYDSQYVYQDQPDGNCAAVSQEKYDFMQDYLMEGKGGFYAYQEYRQDHDDNDVSLQQCAEDFLEKITATEEQKIWMKYILDMDFVQEYSGSVEDMSMFWWDSDSDIPGGDAEMGGAGYQGILEHYVRGIEHWMEFESKVTQIDWTQKEQVTVHYTQNGQAKQIKAKRVLITVPIGVLQAKSIDFQPPLPDKKQRTIDRIGMGLLNKCLMLWDEQDVDQLPWPQDREWMERIVASNADAEHPQGLFTEYFNSRPVTGRPMLCAFTAGRVAEHVEETMSKDEIQQEVLQALSKQFNNATIPPPKQVIVTKWGQDEFARGSYSFNKIGGKHSDRKKLAEPIDNRLYFAGEACHSQYFGTTHGALLSGVNAGKQIAKKSARGSIIMAGMNAAKQVFSQNKTKTTKQVKAVA